jgi:hypothetical protein
MGERHSEWEPARVLQSRESESLALPITRSTPHAGGARKDRLLRRGARHTWRLIRERRIRLAGKWNRRRRRRRGRRPGPGRLRLIRHDHEVTTGQLRAVPLPICAGYRRSPVPREPRRPPRLRRLAKWQTERAPLSRAEWLLRWARGSTAKHCRFAHRRRGREHVRAQR